MTGEAQRFGCSDPGDELEDDLDGYFGVCPPARMHHNGPDTVSAPQPERNQLAVESQGSNGPSCLAGKIPCGQQGPLGDPHRRQVEDRPEMQGQPGTPGVVPARAVDDQHFGTGGKRADGLLQQRALTKRQETRKVPSSGLPGCQRSGVQPPAASQGGRCPCRLPADTARLRPKADEAAGSRRYAPSGAPERGCRSAKHFLDLDKAVGGIRPRSHQANATCLRTGHMRMLGI